MLLPAAPAFVATTGCQAFLLLTFLVFIIIPDIQLSQSSVFTDELVHNELLSTRFVQIIPDRSETTCTLVASMTHGYLHQNFLH